MKILSLVGTAGASHYFRSLVPGDEMIRQFGWDYRTCTSGFFMDSFDYWKWVPDVVILQSVYHADFPAIIRAIKAKHKSISIIYDIDDDLWNFTGNPNPFNCCVIADLMEQADLVTCSSARLADMALVYNDNIFQVPNFIPDWYIEAAVNQAQKHRLGKFVVLFSGGHIHAPDLDMIAPALYAVKKSLKSQVEIVFQGCVPKWGEQLQPIVINNLPINQYFTALSSLEVDVALAPLVDNNYNRAKSYLKMLDYGAARFPVVASDIGEYRQFKGRVKLIPPGQGWERPIFDLIDSHETGNDLAGQLNAWVVAYGKISKGVHLWKEAIEKSLTCSGVLSKSIR